VALKSKLPTKSFFTLISFLFESGLFEAGRNRGQVLRDGQTQVNCNSFPSPLRMERERKTRLRESWASPVFDRTFLEHQGHTSEAQLLHSSGREKIQKNTDQAEAASSNRYPRYDSGRTHPYHPKMRPLIFTRSALSHLFGLLNSFSGGFCPFC
jgi:hypothetical protein